VFSRAFSGRLLTTADCFGFSSSTTRTDSTSSFCFSLLSSPPSISDFVEKTTRLDFSGFVFDVDPSVLDFCFVCVLVDDDFLRMPDCSDFCLTEPNFEGGAAFRSTGVNARRFLLGVALSSVLMAGGKRPMGSPLSV